MRRRPLTRAWPAAGIGLLLPFAFGCPVRFDDTVPASAPGLDSLVDITPVEAGDDCPQGGVRVRVGTDVNRDGALDDEEVRSSTLLCAGADGEDGAALLLRIAPIEPGAECPHGGQELRRGRDTNGDGTLSETEVEATERFCHGTPGVDGARGLIEVQEASEEACPEGGLRIASGVDHDGDGVLSAEETVSSASLCHAAPGTSGPAGDDGFDAIVDAKIVLPGATCPAGGQELRAGYDLDRDGTLTEEEVRFSAVACHGRSIGEGGGGQLSGGTSEGTPALPVELTLGGFFPDAHAHPGSVAAGGSSHYRFTSPDDPEGDDEVPYTLAFHGVETALAVELYPSGDFTGTPLPVECAFEGPSLWVCATPPLVESQAHTVRVSEPRNFPQTYTLSLSFGARTGTHAAPAAAGPKASVAGGGRSVFSLGAVNGVHTIRLKNVRGPSGQEPTLVWDLLESAVVTEASGTCENVMAGDVVCATGVLQGGALIAVRDEAGVGALFDIEVEAGDTISVDGVLSTFEALPAEVGLRHWRRFPVPVAGKYTLAWRFAGTSSDYSEGPQVSVHADHLSAQGAGDRGELALCAHDCVIEVPSELVGGSLYVALPVRTSGSGGTHELALFSEGGDEGGPGVPVLLSLGDNHGHSVDLRSYYRVAASSSPGRVAIRTSSPFDQDLQCQWYRDESFESPADYGYQSRIIENGCVSARREAGEELFVAIFPARLFTDPRRPMVFDLEIVEGDTVTPLLLLEAAPITTPGPGTWVYRLPPLTPGPYVFRTTTTGNVRRRLFGDHPAHVSWRQHLTLCESLGQNTQSSTDPCDRLFTVSSLGPRDHYAQVFTNGPVVTLAVESVPVEDQPFGQSAVYTPARTGRTWIRFETMTQMNVRITVHQDVGGNQRISVYDEGYNEEVFTWNYIYSSGPTTRTYDLSDLPEGVWNMTLDLSGMGADPQMTVSIVEKP